MNTKNDNNIDNNIKLQTTKSKKNTNTTKDKTKKNHINKE